MRTPFASIVLLFAAVVSPLVGQGDDVSDRKTLEGLKGIRVSIRSKNDEARRDGLSPEQLQTDAELRLRLSGIRVLTDQEAPSAPTFVVTVYTFKSSSGFYAVSVSGELQQWVQLTRNPSLTAWASTWWSFVSIGVTPAEDLESARSTVRDLTDQFINAYLAANPKR